MMNLNRFKNLSLEKKSALVFVFATAISSGLNMITTPLFTRLMPVDSFGVVQLFNTWYQVLAVIATFSVTNAVVNVGFHDYPKDRMGYLSASLGLSTLFTIIVSAVLFVTNDWFLQLSGLSISLLVLMILSFLFKNSTQLWICLNRYELKYKIVFVVMASTAVLSSVISLIAVYSTSDYYAEVRLWSAYTIPLLVGIVLFVYIAVKGKKFYNKQYWHFILVFNAPLLIHYLSQFILSSSDRLMIKYYSNEEDVAIYSLGYLVSNILMVFFSPINSVIIPRTHKLVDTGNDKEIERFLFKLLISIGAIVLMVSLLSPEIMAVLGGDAYRDGVRIVPIVSASTLFTILYLYVANIEFLYGKTTRIATMTIIAAVMNIVLNAIFIPLFGFVAAAYTTLAAYAIYAILHMYNLKKLQNKSIISFKTTLLICGVFVALCLVCVAISEMSVLRYLLLSIAAVAIAITFKQKKIKLTNQ